MSPCALRTYHLSRSSGTMRKGASRLHVDLLDAALVDEVVDVGAAPGRRQRGVHVRHRQSQRAGVHAVDVDAELRRVFLPVRAHARPAPDPWRPAPSSWLRAADQRFVAGAGAVLQIDVEAVGHAEFEHGRRRKREHHGVAQLREGRHRPPGDRLHAVLRAWPLLPVLQPHERDAGVLSATGEAKSPRR